MEILNIGPLELILIVSFMILLLGPEDMRRLTRWTGRIIREARQSSIWKEITRTSKEVQELPTTLAREAGFDEQAEEIRRSTQIRSSIYPPPKRIPRKSGDVRSPDLHRKTFRQPTNSLDGNRTQPSLSEGEGKIIKQTTAETSPGDSEL